MRGLRIALASAGAALLFGAAPALAGPLLPDVRVRPLPTKPNDPQVIDGPNGKQLSFTNEWANFGDGPFEVAPHSDPLTDDCDVDGDPTNDATIDERVYQDSNGNNVFERGVDTGFTASPAGCMVFHPEHNHFHIANVGRYSLLTEPTGASAGGAFKLTVCLEDEVAFFSDPPLPGTPPTRYYGSCNSLTAPQGISIGWYDSYGANLSGQQIDLNPGLPAGNYCLRSEFDPNHIFVEKNATNNLTEQRYYLDAAHYTVQPLTGACIFDEPPPDTTPPDTTPPDTTPPDTTIVAGPKRKTTKDSPKFRFRANEPATFNCRLDHKPWRPCKSPKKYHNLDLSRHKFSVRATDAVGNVEPKPARDRFKVVEA
jgi:hypothetical protein